MRILVAGVGNVLRKDDGFGPAVAAALEARRAELPPDTTVLEVGIGGMGLIHELFEGYDALIVVDAAERGAEPGTLFVLEPERPPRDALPGEEGRLLASDMHELVPARVLTMAAALDVLPPRVRLVGCQPADTDELSLELSPAVAAAVPRAATAVIRLTHELAASPAGV